ncbi:MAG TPA: GGDEF domain-containing protein [Ruminococcaceae bacterium]|nr:GGDEF domain-containing protein [Oscillospiraceae bacterium]HCK50325.1 GGDEF domain-containing protein [Oscillospiraceae bacterium]
MIFDYKAYSRLLNEFIIEGEKIEQYRDTAFNKILEPICKFLRISRLSSAVFGSTCDSAIIKSAPYVYYDDGNADSTRVLKFTETNMRAGKATYIFMQSKSGQDWSDEEVQQIEAFEKLIYTFCDRSYASTIAKDLSMLDNDLMVYPLTFFLATVKNLIRQGRIGEFGGVYFNLRHFSSINDRFGRDCATNIMRLFIHGIQEKILYEECICRVGGDNFVVLFKKDNLNIIKNYLSGMPITFNDVDETVTVTTTAGYYMIPEATESATDVMDRISTAYQLAKSVYKRPFLFYDDEIMQHQTHVKEIEMMFPSAIENEEFKVFYQPKTQLNNYQLAGAEALCRWFRNGKVISPGEFIPVLEGSKAICTLDFYMLDHVCRDIRRWLDEGREAVKVSVNLSRLHLGDEDLLESILRIIDKYKVPHHFIEIELTETTTDVDYKELKKVVYGLREQDISTSVDDFGVGYSSLNLIREMPWNVLKIDKSFLPTQEEEDKDPSKVKMLRHIITMSQDLGLECIVEGVETAEQVKLLKDCKCYLAQGFYFDRPLPVKEFEQKLESAAG